MVGRRRGGGFFNLLDRYLGETGADIERWPDDQGTVSGADRPAFALRPSGWIPMAAALVVPSTLTLALPVVAALTVTLANLRALAHEAVAAENGRNLASSWSRRRRGGEAAACRLLAHRYPPHERCNTSTTWPPEWSERMRGKDCPMCAQGRPDEDEYGIRIHAGRYSDAYLQRASWQLGYTIVVWRGRHVAEPTELDAQEASGYWLEVLQVASALQRHYRPVKMNYQTLGNAVPHLHTHLVPRFAQDPAPGRPLPFPEGERPRLPEETFRRDALALRAMV